MGCKSSKPVRVVPGETIVGEEPLGEGEPLGEEPLGEGEPLGEEPLEWRHTNETLREWVKRWCDGERVAAHGAGEALVAPGECEGGVPARSTGLPHISKWDTSAVTDMSSLFKDQKDFNDDISGWDTGAVTTMSRMFEGAS